VSSRIGPRGDSQSGGFGLNVHFGGVLFTFGLFCAAMFAQPTITQIEEVIGLVHDSGAKCRMGLRGPTLQRLLT
jgi:hypothetical protein